MWKRRMRQRNMAGLILLWVLLGLLSVHVRADDSSLDQSELYARSAALMDGRTGRVLYEKEGHLPLANASTTKILTCILILENCDTDDVTKVSAKAAAQPKVRLGMKTGQKFYVRDMLYALMLESFNDCAVVLAEHLAGSVEEFADQMNQKASEIGCQDSHFVTPNGLDGEDEGGKHHTTAVDLSKLMRYCILESPKREQFLQITQTSSHSFRDAEGRGYYTCYNHNALLTMMTEAISGKTGFTNQAGYCYVGAAEENDRTLIVALLGCGWPPQKNYKWMDSVKLIEYGFTHFRVKQLSEQIETFPDIRIQGCREEKIKIQQEGELSAMVAGEERLIMISRIRKERSGQIRAGECMGNADYYADGECLGSLSICSVMESHELTYTDYLRDLTQSFLVDR